MADKLLEKILDSLDKQLNPNSFELCAIELIRKDFPATVPVVGGSDSGMDGAVADLEGEAFPIVCTTSENVIRNFTDSLQSYLNNGNKRRKVISVTNRRLSPQQQQNLKDRAREMGFTLVQIYERQAIAERLRESPRWCKDLLGLTADLPALSEIPPHFRTEGWNDKLVGRDEELEWLKNLSSDALLFGQPGAGKTAILKKITETKQAFFICTENSDAVIAAFRELKPKIVILDDAHVHENRFELLLRIRSELKVDFKILASVWLMATISQESTGIGGNYWKNVGNNFHKLFRSSAAFLTGSAIYAKLFLGGVMNVGGNGLQGYVESWFPAVGDGASGLTIGNAATFSDTSIAAHEFSHTLQFIGISALSTSPTSAINSYLGVGALGAILRFWGVPTRYNLIEFVE